MCEEEENLMRFAQIMENGSGGSHFVESVGLSFLFEPTIKRILKRIVIVWINGIGAR